MKFKDSMRGSVISMVLISTVVLGAYSGINKEILITIDGKTSEVDTISTTVGELLNSKKISLEEGSILQPSIDTKLKNNMEIKIVNEYKINIDDGGNLKEYKTNKTNVEEVLESCNIVLGEKDILSKNIEDKVNKEDVIKITRVKEEEIKETEKIPFKTETIKDKTLVQGKQKTITTGQDGELEITYKVTYNNEEIVSKEKISERITKAPINAVIKKGTLQAESI